MKTLTSILLFPLCLFSQVGINTTNPIATLDVEGDLRIAVLDPGTDTSARDSILVVDGNNVVKMISARDIFRNIDKTIIKGRMSTGANVPANGIIPFDTLDFDKKNEFNTTAYEFTTATSGIYRVDVQLTMGAISIGMNGVGIYKVDTSDVETLVAQDRFLNIRINLLAIDVTVNPPTRRTGTLVQLQAGEKIRFKNSGLLTLSLLNNPADTFFSIEQVR